MTPHKLLRTGIPLCLGAFLAVLFWVAMVPKEIATAVPPIPTPPLADSETSFPDAGWLNLLKALQANNETPNLSLTLNVNLNTHRVAGHTPLGSSITLSVTRGDTLVATALTTPVPDLPGFFYQTYLDWNEYPYGFQPGDLIWLEQAGTIVTMTIPTLTARASSPDDTVSGLGPANASLFAYLLPFADPGTSFTQTATTDADGAYQIDWGSSPGVEPADRGFVAYTPAANQSVFSLFVAPLLRAQLNGTEISGYAAPYSSVYLTIRDTNGELLISDEAYTSDDGYFSIIGYERFPEATIQPGYHIFADAEGQTFSMTVQALTIALDAQNSEITGETNPNSPVQVFSFDGPMERNPYADFWTLPPDEAHSGTTNASGEFSFPLALNSANYGAAAVTGPNDFLTYVRFNLPFIRVFQRAPYDYHINFLVGQVNQFNALVNIAIQGPSGYLKDIFSVNTGSDGYIVGGSVENNDLSISTGDVITVSTENGVETSMHVPTFTVETDPEADTVSGQAPPAALLSIDLSDYRYDKNTGWEPVHFTLVVTTTAEGTYQGDFTDQGGFSENAEGFVALPLQGNELIARFDARSYCPPVPTLIQVYSNQMDINASSTCAGTFLRLLDAQGEVKYTTYLEAGTGSLRIELYDTQNGTPILILPEDTLEIETEGELFTYPIPQLTASLEAGSHQITGIGPANTPLQIAVFREQLSDTENYSITTNAQGQFDLTLPTAPAFTAGDRIYLTIEEEYPYFSFSTGLPLLEAKLYTRGLSGWLPPYSTFDATWQSVDGSILQTQGQTTPWGELFINWPYTVPFTLTNQPGDQFTLIYENPLTPGSETLVYTLPELTAHLNKNTATVSGNAPANSSLNVEMTADGDFYPTKHLTSTMAGTYSIGFPEASPISFAYGIVTHFNPEGFKTQVPFATTHWDLTLGQSCIQGTADSPGAYISIHLQSADNTLSETVTAYANSYNGGFEVCFSTQTVQPGAQFTLETLNSTTSYTVPEISATYDPQRKVIEGIAIPNTEITLFIQTGGIYPLVSRQTIAQPDGSFGLDVSDLSPYLNSWASISLTDTAGNQLSLDFQIRGYTLFLPVINHPPE